MLTSICSSNYGNKLKSKSTLQLLACKGLLEVVQKKNKDRPAEMSIIFGLPETDTQFRIRETKF